MSSSEAKVAESLRDDLNKDDDNNEYEAIGDQLFGSLNHHAFGCIGAEQAEE